MAIEFKDYYAALGVKKDASADEIKAAYRRLARQHHPDLHPEKNKVQAGEKFKQINEAYEVLSDPEKKSKYDRVGPGWDAQQAPPPRREAPQGHRPGAGEQFEGFSDFFESLFGARGGGGFQGGPRPRRGPARGQDIEAEVSFSLEDAFRGGERRFTTEAPSLCPACRGAGRQGRGFCPSCGGVGEISRQKTITVNLPPHARDGLRLRVRGQGGPGPDGGEPGDLYLRVHLLPHPELRVLGSDLEATVTVTPWDAALGAEAAVPSPEGPIRIKIPAGTHAGRRLRIAGRGLRRDGSRGDLYAVVRIDIPERSDARLEKLYREMKEASG